MSDFDERARRASEGLKRALDDADLPVDDGERKTKRRIVKRTAAVSSVAAFALFAGLVTVLPDSDKNQTVALSGQSGAFQLAGALQPFGACDDALDYFKKHAAEFYLSQGGGDFRAVGESLNSGDTATSSAKGDAPVTTIQRSPQATQSEVDSSSPEFSAPATDKSTSGSHSTTNVAEKNVDEPDIVKTDGTRIVTVTLGKARLLSANDGNPIVRSVLSANNVKNVFFTGDRLVVFRAEQPLYAYDMPSYDTSSKLAYGSQRSTVVLYDIADIANPKTLGSFDVTGDIVDARMVGTQVRLVTSYTPDVNVTPEWNPNGSGYTDATKRKLNDTIAASKLEQWTPTFTLRDAAGAETAKGQLVECADLGRPQAFAGIGTTALVTFDAAGSLSSRHSAGVVAGGQQVYGTEKSIYVTSTDWTNGKQVHETNIHSFAAEDNGAVKYQGSGLVAGTLLNQYSMSEFDGALRVATTTTDSQGWINRQSKTQGQVAVLKLKDGKLQQVGLVTGLGAKDNESIQSVRFVGARGYVTTFRQTDPFYVLDLSKAESPKVTGELKIPGFSSYLHPISDKLILGVGQSGNGFGGAEIMPMSTTIPGRSDSGSSGASAPSIAPAPAMNGVEFSLFDVSDPANPKKITGKQYGSGTAGAQFDAKAFLYYEPMDLIVSPLSEYSYSRSGSSHWTGLVLLRATDNGLVEVGRLQNSESNMGFNVERTFIIGNNVYQLSQGALQVNSLETHKQIARVTL